MEQLNKYSVKFLGLESVETLNSLDKGLISSYRLPNTVFLPNKYTVNLNFYDLNNVYIGTVQNLSTYQIRNGAAGVEQATQIYVNPIQDALGNGYNGDVILEYEVFNNLFSSNKFEDTTADLYVFEISTDRTEIRAKSTHISDTILKYYANSVYTKLNGSQYFSEIYLNFLESNLKVPGINISTEILGDGTFCVLFKLYEPLPVNVVSKSKFTVLERIGTPVRFQIDRVVEIVESPMLTLKEPNFNVDVPEVSNGISEYYNYNQLFSFPLSSSYYQLYSLYGEDSAQISIDHEDFSSFIHFSSAVERLENFRYKLTLLKHYRDQQNRLSEINPNDPGTVKYDELIQGILTNFDHYEKFLYFSNSSKAWPKQSISVKPYVNLDPENPIAQAWWSNMLSQAQEYDDHNEDILVNSIPFGIRENEVNEPYVIFIHMIGQHFDNEWIYAKAVSDKYKADNRLDFGISKDLVKDALSDLGIKLCESNQNLSDIFDLCNYDGTYDTGSESSVNVFKRITATSMTLPQVYDGEYSGEVILPSGRLDGEYAYWTGSIGITADGGPAYSEWFGKLGIQPVFIDDYRKEIYKRIYHNVPFLLKTKGTSRGLRALISCFGIPQDILTIKTLGGGNLTNVSYFGPLEECTSSLDHIRISNTGSIIPIMIESGSIITGSVVSFTKPVVDSKTNNAPGSHQIVVGFDLNSQFNEYVKSKLTIFNYDDLVGDPRNLKENNYGSAFTLLKEKIFTEIQADGISFRSPAAIIRLVRYIDTMLMRSIQFFISAHDDASVGVIVEDNLLHRNRYADVKLESKAGDLETTLLGTVASVTGSSGGSFNLLPSLRTSGSSKEPVYKTFTVDITHNSRRKVKAQCPTTAYEERVLTPGDSLNKPVFDESPKFTGELSGSIFTVPIGRSVEIRKGTRRPLYTINLQFLNLPQPGEMAAPEIRSIPSEIIIEGGRKSVSQGTVNVYANTNWYFSN